MSNHHKFNNSSSIAHCDYEDDSNTLIIKFNSSATEHKYPGCPKAHYEALKQAASAGKYFHQHIRGKYEG